MADEKLRAVVDEIQAQLARAEGLGEGPRRSLERLVADLEGMLEPSPPAAVDETTLRPRAADWVTRLEASHPELSRTLGNLIDTLAFFGL
jgi:hypothetical protein